MDKRRAWMRVCLQEALDRGVLDPEDVLQHATPTVLATDLPPELVASLLQAGLDTGAFDANAMVHHLGSEQLAEHVPLPVLWSCLDEAAKAVIREHPATTDHGGEPIIPINTSVEPDEQPEIELVAE
jgi:hypothetical protein